MKYLPFLIGCYGKHLLPWFPLRVARVFETLSTTLSITKDGACGDVQASSSVYRECWSQRLSLTIMMIDDGACGDYKSYNKINRGLCLLKQ